MRKEHNLPRKKPYLVAWKTMGQIWLWGWMGLFAVGFIEGWVPAVEVAGIHMILCDAEAFAETTNIEWIRRMVPFLKSHFIFST